VGQVDLEQPIGLNDSAMRLKNTYRYALTLNNYQRGDPMRKIPSTPSEGFPEP
jgi:hypothetical protein